MKAHKWFSDFVSEGVVDFAVVDCENIPSVPPPLSPPPPRSSWSSATRSSRKRPCRTRSSSWRTTCSAISATTRSAWRTVLSSAACSPFPAATPPTPPTSSPACSSLGSSPRCRRPSWSPTTPRCSRPSPSTASPSTFASLRFFSVERHRPPPHRRRLHAAPAPQARAPAPRPPRRRHRRVSTFPRSIGLPRSGARGGPAQPVHQRARLALDADELPRAGSLRAVAGGNSVPLAVSGRVLGAGGGRR